MGRDRVGLFAAIREDHRQGMGVRAIAREHGVHRRTVREALASPVPAPRKVPERASPARDSVAPLIDAMLTADLDAPRKQRHTARRVWVRLRDEHDAEASYSYVAKYVARRRPEIEAERKGRAGSLEGFVPQAKEPGAEAEVDFGPVTITLDGQDAACHLFAYRLSFSGMGVHRVYASCAQEALLEGHVTAFAVTGGVPAAHIRYDNLTPAVTKVLQGRDRKENARWLSFRTWYGFDAFYCEPGIGGAHEKGGVEGEIGRFRRNYLVPVPRVKSLADLNARLAEDDLRDGLRHVEFRRDTVAADFAKEAPLLRPLPADGFDTGTTLWPKADKFARVSVGKCRYSVPARLIGKAVRIRLGANELTVFEGGKAVAVHPRLVASGDEHLLLDHYLEILARKPGALPGSVPLAQARADGSFTAAHEALWSQARRKLGDGAGTRALIEVLLLHRRLPAASVTAGIEAALRSGTCSPDVVAVQARLARRRGRPGGGAAGAGPAPVAGGGHHAAAPGRAAAGRSPAPAGRRRLRPAAAARAAAAGGKRIMSARRDELTEPAMDAAIERACTILRLPTVRDRHGEVAGIAQRQQASYKGFLTELLSLECDDRETRRRARLVREAGFPRPKRIEDFDFSANPDVPAALIGTLARCQWVAAGQPLCLVGDSGTGKSHLLIGLGTAAAEQGYRVRYVTAAALVNELAEAADDRMLTRVIARYGRIELLCLDELGYIELDRRGAELLFQVFTEREEKSSIAVASNAAFSEWAQAFTDPRLCAAIVDRLTYNAHIITTGTGSYRLRSTTARHQAAAKAGRDAKEKGTPA